jgi:hypothetical protein
MVASSLDNVNRKERKWWQDLQNLLGAIHYTDITVYSILNESSRKNAGLDVEKSIIKQNRPCQKMKS